jgi:hypothetical protein
MSAMEMVWILLGVIWGVVYGVAWGLDQEAARRAAAYQGWLRGTERRDPTDPAAVVARELIARRERILP